MESGFGALFERRGDGEETPLQGLYQDLLICLGGVEAQQAKESGRQMTGFAEILNVIMEVINERQNTATTGDLFSTLAGDLSKTSLKTPPENEPESTSEAMDTSYIESATESIESITTITLSRPGTTTAESDTDSESSFIVTTTDAEYYDQDQEKAPSNEEQEAEEEGKRPGEEEGDACCHYRKDLPPIPATPFAQILPVPSKVAKLVAAFGLEGLVPVSGYPVVVRPCFEAKGSGPEKESPKEELKPTQAAISREFEQDDNGNLIEKKRDGEEEEEEEDNGAFPEEPDRNESFDKHPASDPEEDEGKSPPSAHSSVDEAMEEITAPLYMALNEFNLNGETIARHQPRAVTVLPILTIPDRDPVPAASLKSPPSERAVQTMPQDSDSGIDLNGNWMDRSPLSIGAAMWTQMLDRMTGISG